MHYEALTKAQRALYDAAVATTHHRAIEVEVYRRSNGAPVTSFTRRFMGGSVQGDTSRTPVTTLECDIFDDDYALDWANGAHRQFEVQVIDSRFVPALDDWVEAHVFRGPIWTYSREGAVVHLTAEGPEWNAMGSVKRHGWWPAKTRATAVIRYLLARAGAEPSDLRIPSLKATLPRAVTVGVRVGKDNKKTKKDEREKRQRLKIAPDDSYWPKAHKIAEALDRDLFGDAKGRFILATARSRPTLQLTNRVLLAAPSEKPGTDGEIPNTWIVTGANPKGPRKQVKVTVELPDVHDASAAALRWNGTRREVIVEIKNKHLKTDKQARRVGERKRDRVLRETVTYEISALPIIPWLRPETMVSVPTGGGRVSSRVTRWTLPLGPGPDPLVLGANRRRGLVLQATSGGGSRR